MSTKSLIKSVAKTVHKHQKTKPDVFIFTLPRAGSTLMAEILNSDIDCKMASESFALNRDNIQILKKYFTKDFLSERYVDVSSEELNQMVNYYSDLSAGKHWNAYYWSDILKPCHQFNTCRTIFKTHKVTYYFDDIMTHFGNDYGLYLLRHPISHSLSRMGEKWDTYIDLFSQAKKIKPIISSQAKTTIEEIRQSGNRILQLAVSWCLENYIFIKQYQESELPVNVIPVFYEDLVQKTEETVKNICAKIEMKYNPQMPAVVNSPSSGIVHSTKEIRGQIKAGNKEYLINRWKDDVDKDDLLKINEILQIFDIQLYK